MNPLRHVIVHVDGSEQALERLRFARAMTQPFSARITALHAVTPWLVLHPARHEGDQAAAEGMPDVSWDQVRTQSPYGRHANHEVPDDFVPSVIMHSGKPALIVPATGHALSGHAIKSALIAWNGSRESARALSAAWPFLASAQEVHVAMLGDTIVDEDPACRARLARYLGLHGIEPIWHVRQAPSPQGVGAALLSLAQDVKADLLVMGCYGHSRTREWVLGGATRTVLSNMSLPVLMAH